MKKIWECLVDIYWVIVGWFGMVKILFKRW
jgi:hypothetical protein